MGSARGRLILETQLVGSYPQPEWLIDRERLAGRLPVRVRAPELWRVEPELLDEAQADAARLVVRELEELGLDVVTDGEVRRESYSNHFAVALAGLDVERPGTILSRAGKENLVPRVVGPVRRTHPAERDAAELLRATATRRTKVTVPGPFTMAQQAVDEHYRDGRALALALAEAVNEELRELAGIVDVVQIDEPWLQSRPEPARAYAVEAIDRALAGVECETVLHTCFGYAHVVADKPHGYPFLAELDACAAGAISIEAAQPRLDPSTLRALPSKTIVLGVLDLGDPQVESVEAVAARIRAALEHVEPERLALAPDCGMKYLPREVARGKVRAMVEAAALVRAELGPD